MPNSPGFIEAPISKYLKVAKVQRYKDKGMLRGVFKWGIF
jgi:hypothetical protein